MKTLLILLPVLMLAACRKDGDQPRQTKDWYVQHDSERLARVKACKNDGALEATADCQNAINADAQVYAFGKH